MNDPKKFGLDTKIIKSINSVFSNYAQIKSVFIYGSRAKGNFKEGSDIDLVIKAPTLKTKDLLKIENEIENLMLAYKIDLSLFHQIENSDLIDHIQRVGIVFFPPS